MVFRAPHGTGIGGSGEFGVSAPDTPVRGLAGSNAFPEAGRTPGKEFQLCVSALDNGQHTMLFYVALAIACIVAATVCLWLYRSMVEVGKTAYRTILPSGGNRRFESRRQKTFVRLNSTVAQTRSPWGWSKHNAPSRSRAGTGGRSGEQVPWGWPGSSGLKRSNLDLIGRGLETSAAVDSVRSVTGSGNKDRNKVGWPYREERFEFKGRSRRTAAREQAVTGGKSKPWGW